MECELLVDDTEMISDKVHGTIDLIGAYEDDPGEMVGHSKWVSAF